jgi:hypothetical protein
LILIEWTVEYILCIYIIRFIINVFFPISSSAAAKPREIVSEIRNLLNQTIQAHKQQNYAEAEALATTAYLDNYEFIEAPLAEKDNALMENTEVMLRTVKTANTK